MCAFTENVSVTCVSVSYALQLVSVHQYLVEYHISESFASTSLPNVSRVATEALHDATLARMCRAAMDRCVDAARRDASISSTQRQVMEELRRMQLAPQEEFVDDLTGYSIDGVVTVAGERAHDAAAEAVRVAVEVDGPSHYAHSPDASSPAAAGGGESSCAPGAPASRSASRRMLLGGTVMKKRHLGRAGYTVMSVPYWEWDALNAYNVTAQREARQQYLRGKLRGLGVAQRDGAGGC